ncbi:MAG: type III PLP-dependent enzyme [Alphaproteobacteria bacterium]|nr:type III PLP-dependent enzyme [Alphaproteobacteria bacterium]
MTEKIRRFLRERQPETPCLVMDLDAVADSYLQLTGLFPEAQVFYAVKANPAPEILARLNTLGSSFDVASPGEIDICLGQGATADRMSYGNTIKKERDIAYAHQRGVRLYAFDSESELEKLQRAAPGARVFCRILVDCGGAEWPLSRKFGCSPEMAADLLRKARDYGLDPYGIAFHVGSQQTDLKQWDAAVGLAARVFTVLREANVDLRMVNVGGGFPARYRTEIPTLKRYAGAVTRAMTKHFGNNLPQVLIEPGRSMVGDAGIIQSEVVLVSTKDYGEDKRWVYLDVGKFSGLAETLDEAIKYRIRTPHDGGETGPVVIAGPTCDSADILYEKTEYHLPRALKAGDRVEILSTGAYTSSYSSVGFNGFSPLKTYCI